ncbi:MAG: ABC transporter substrate-binding protein, partial [Acidimicrobiia bacterium]|nr:ABC transporter substrate-binding protein [Acidimicrobiia bacterium]
WALALALALIAAACGGDDDDETTDTTEAATETEDTEAAAEDEEEPAAEEEEAMAEGGAVSYGIVEPSWIDSFNTQDSEGFEVARLLFDGLTDYGADLEAVPAVATDWSTDDNVTWTFNLRDDVTFHNGDPVTAQSFVDAFNRVANPDNLSDVSYQGSAIAQIEGWADVEAGEATEISGVTAVDDTTLEITLASAYPVLPKVLAHPVFSPVNLAAVEAGGDGYSDAPVGNGPYMMDGTWEHDVAIDLARYDGYYGDAGVPDAINFQIYDSIETMYLEAQAGNLDIADVPPENIETAESDFPDRFIELATGSYNYLGFPTQTPPFDNPDIRRALSLAIDRDTITTEIFAGTRAPASGFAPPLAPGAIGDCANTAFDPDAAKELFDAAGGVPGNTVTIYFNSGGGHEDWTQAVANGWLQTLGIETEFVAQEFAPYLDQLQGGEVDGPYRLGWLWDAPTAENFLSPLFLSTSGDNYSAYVSDTFDTAIADFRAAPSEIDGFPALETAQQTLCDDMPVAPMFFGTGQKVYTENVDNVVYTVFGYTELENVEVGS